MFLPAAFTLVLISGIVLFFVGLRGRRVNEHPHCRACGFDLTGRYPQAEKCPECGGSVSDSKNIRTGRREKRLGVLALGAAVSLLGAFLLTSSIWLALQGTSIQKHLPTWALQWQLSWSDDVTIASALSELELRLSKGELAQAATDAIVARGLQRQGDLALPWIIEWGDFIESVHAKGELSKEDADRYGRQFVVIDLAWRRIVQSGAHWPLRRTVSETRGGSGSGYRAQVTLAAIQYGEQMWQNAASAGFFGFGLTTGTGSSSSTTSRPLDFVPDDDATLSVTSEYRVSFNGSGTIDVTWTETTNTDAIVVPSDETTVTMIPDDSLLDRLMNTVRIETVRIVPDWRDATRDNLDVDVGFAEPPTNIAFDVYVLVDGEELHVGQVSAPKNKTNHQFQVSRAIGRRVDEELEHVTVFLRSNPDAALKTVDLFEIWGGELIYKNVPVEHGRQR